MHGTSTAPLNLSSMGVQLRSCHDLKGLLIHTLRVLRAVSNIYSRVLENILDTNASLMHRKAHLNMV